MFSVGKQIKKDENIFSDTFVSDYTNNIPNSNKQPEINLIENQIETTPTIAENSKRLSCWILDSGASIHTTYDISLLTNI